MYCGDISTTTVPALLNVLIAADKYEVASCVRYCCMLLHKFPMTWESALLYLDLPSIVSTGEAVQALIDAAKQFLVAHCKDFTKFQDKMLKFPLVGIEAVLSSDDLQMDSENDIYDFVLRWTRMHHPELEDRKQAIGSSLAPLVRFPFMSLWKLKGALTGTDFEFEPALKLIENAISFKSQAQFPLPTHLVERDYRYLPIKVVESRPPGLYCIVYMNITRERCSKLFPSGSISSQAFRFGEHNFYLYAKCGTFLNRTSLGFYLGMHGNGSASLACDYALNSSQTGLYTTKRRGKHIFQGGKNLGYKDLLGFTWSELVAENSPYLVNGALRLKVRLEPVATIKQQQHDVKAITMPNEVKIALRFMLLFIIVCTLFGFIGVICEEA